MSFFLIFCIYLESVVYNNKTYQISLAAHS